MQTSKWGRDLWNSLYFIAAGYDLNDSPDKESKYITFLKSIEFVLPCKYCRDSTKVFMKELDIKKFISKNQKYGLMKFIYALETKVNNKLTQQEYARFDKEFSKLDTTDPQFVMKTKALAESILKTKPMKPFREVRKNIMQYKASCSDVKKTCAAPKRRKA